MPVKSENEVAGESVMASVAPPLETALIGNGLFIPEGLYEVVGDRIVEKPPMGVLGATLASLLLELMGPYARSMQLGQVFSEVLFDLRPLVDGSRRPDLAFLSAAKWPLNRRGPEAESWPIIPDLAIEIVSPTNYAAKLLDKVREYEQAGVGLVWVIYPSAREVHVFDAANPSVVRRLQGGDRLKGEPVLAGFELDLAMLFGDSETE
jgi:Uma2 family endonuclease